MKKIAFLFVAFLVFSSHDMYLKMDTYFLQPNTQSVIQLFNGTFEKSDNIITRDRMQDVSLVGNGTRTAVDTSQWADEGETTILDFTTGDEGTWVAGVSTKPRNIEMEAEDFNDYLKHDGVLDMLEWRKQNDKLGEDAVEKYSKHVKTIFQVGNKKTEDWQTVLGYPIEFVPISNPYDAKVGDDLQVKLLWKGQPLSNQLVYAGSQSDDHDHSHDSSSENDHSHEEHHHDATQLRTNENGIVTMSLVNDGQWYLRTIHLESSDEEGLTHESNWATLTFEVGSEGSHDHGMHRHGDGELHSHQNGHHHGIPYYVYILAGVVIIAGLFLMLRRRGKE